MNNSQVAHLWANQSRESAKGSNFFFDGTVIFSYGRHFPVARLTDATDENGEPVALLNSGSYSISTSRHQSYARQALRDGQRAISVPHVVEDRHAENLAFLEKCAADALLAFARAREKSEWKMEAITRARADAVSYAVAFGLPVPEFAPLSDEVLANVAKAAREKSAAKRKEEAERAARNAARLEEYAQQWRTGGRDSMPWEYPETLLRPIECAKMIETSRGARVKSTHARKLWNLVRDCQANGRAYRVPPDAPFAVGDFSLREIRTDGTAIVGCHTLTFAEMRRCAVDVMGWEG